MTAPSVRLRPRQRPAFLAVVIAALALAAFALPVAASLPSVWLGQPAVSPLQGTTATTISFRVIYKNRTATPASSVTVVLDDSGRTVTFPMHQVDSGNPTTGVHYEVDTKVPVGNYHVSFTSDPFAETFLPSTLTITAAPTPTPTPKPTPTPTPAPTPTPKPTPTPTPKPTPTPTPAPTPTPKPPPTPTPRPTPTPVPPPTPTPRPTATPPTSTPTPKPPSTATPAPTATPPTSTPTPPSAAPTATPRPSTAPRPTAGASAAPAGSSASPTPGLVGAITNPSGPGAGGPGAATGGSGNPANAGVAMDPAILRSVVDAAWSVGLGSASAGVPSGSGASGDEPGAPIAPSHPGPTGGGQGGSPFASITGLVGGPGDDVSLRLFTVGLASSAVTSVGLAFLMFGRRRRDESPPASDEELAAAAATGYPVTSSTFGVPLLIPAAATVGVDPGTGGTDVDLPRWRRPSLIAARKSDPVRDAHAHASVTFSAATSTTAAVAGAEGEAGRERHRVRFHIVQLLDRPDELLGCALSSLDEGDEVEVVERHGLYRRVVTPDGRQGWLHRMTLGEVQATIDGPAGSEPESGETLLSAYLAARNRT